jgi:hypothetical protein
MSTKNSSGGGIGLCGMLAVLFIGLKLGEVGVVATWSWWAVLAPLWVPFLILVVLLLLCAIAIGLIKICEPKKKTH